MGSIQLLAAQPAYSVSVSEIRYRVTNKQILRALVYKPEGEGSFPAMICVHGGAWVSGDRYATQGFADLFAACGFVVMAVDFRMAPYAPYPSSLVDINYAIRWLKQNAAQYSVDPEMIGGLGVSSGGHLILLSAMRPDDARYTEAKLDGAEELDARLSFVITCSGVLDPLARYHMAQKIGERDILACHNAYFGSEAAMSEASPPLILERGEKADLPPGLFFQGGRDERVPDGTAEHMAALYKLAGGVSQAVVYENMEHAVGAWGRRELFDLLSKTVAFVAEYEHKTHQAGA